MNVQDPADPLLPPGREGHHRSARERQRKGPMWGCLKGMLLLLVAGAVLLILIIGGGWWYLGTTSFAGLVRARIEETLENRLGREVHIGQVVIVRSRPQKVILNDVRIANAPSGVARYFATVRQVEITGGVESFWGRAVKVDRVDIRDPRLWFEIAPDGSHNFPKWKSGPKRPREIVRLDIGKLYITKGAFSFNDRKHEILAVANDIASTVSVTRAEGLYAGLMTSPLVRVRIQDYLPFDLKMRGGFRYTPGVLALQSVALEGKGIEAYVGGKLDPLTEAVYDLRLTSKIELERVREIFAVDNTLDGAIALDTRLRGKAGDFELTGGWSAPHIEADAYELVDARGKLTINGENVTVDVDKATYGGGTIGAHYTLANYAEPYPMRVDLRYAGISIEQLFSDWGVDDTGLRGGATGALQYRWEKDRILDGSGTGKATLAKSSVAFSNARYPIPVSGSTDFALNRGVVTFRNAELDTNASHVSLSGSLKIEGVVTDLKTTITSSDFSELDRVGFNFAHAADKRDYELLGLGGAGTINATVKGPIDTPQVAAVIDGTGVRYNDVLLGAAGIELKYDGVRSLLTFDRAVFQEAGGTLALQGTVEFLDEGGPRFDIALEASGYPAQRAIDAIGLEMQIGEGLATGRMLVAGTPETGRATFVNLLIRRGEVASLRLDGSINWLPGEGNVAFDLDVAATNFPVADIAAFLEFADIPVTGNLTGTLELTGRKEALEGSGAVTISAGSIFGEPIDLASADIAFTQGKMRATNVIVRAPAGEIRGDAELDLEQESFSYSIASSSIDLSRLQLLSGLRELLGGNVVFESTGAGTFTNPELVVSARLEGATLQGLDLPPGTSPPSLYIAIRGGRLVVRGGIADIVTIEGEGSVGENLAVDGLIRVTIADVARALALSPKTASLPASGNLVLDLRLGGRMNPIEAFVVEATVPVFNLTFAEHAFTAPQPLRITLRDGRIEFDSFTLQRPDSLFSVVGYAEITGQKRMNLDVRGRIDAALAQLFAPDVRADGQLDVAMSITGAIADPTIAGTAELIDAEVKFSGLPQLIDNINGTFRFNGDRIAIESVRATVGGGSVVAGGSITLDGLMPSSFRIPLQGDDVSVRYIEGLSLVSDFTLVLAGDMERASLTGDVDVSRALYFRDFDVQQTLLNAILARNRVAPVSTATWQDRVGLNIELSAPGTIAIRNNIAEITASAELHVGGTIANPVVLGDVQLDEGGTIRIQNVDYEVTRGTIAFQNPFRIDPYFDVTIEGTVSGFGAESESGPYEVTLNLTGTLDRMMPTITSDPPASDITLFSILGLGGIGSRDSSATGGVGVLGQSLLYQSLSSLVGSRVFPFVDAFTYDPGDLETGSGSGAKVTFEKRLSNKVRFLLVYNLTDNESRQVVEWVVSPEWTLQLARDETDEYRLDARFRRRYEAYWRMGDDERKMATAAVMVASNETAPATLTPLPQVTAVDPKYIDGLLVAQINFRADAQFDTNALQRELALAPGKAATIRDLQSSIRNLFATGNFRDIRVDAVRSTEGAVITFSLYLHYRVGEISIEGLGRSDLGRARRELTVQTGEVLSLNDVDDSADAIQRMLQRYGYLEATVDPETNFDRARNLAEVTFYATPGPRAVIGSVTLEGQLAPFTAEELLKQMKRGEGRSFQLRDARDDAGRMLNFLVRRDYRRAKVEFLGETYDSATKQVALRYRIDVGPLVQVAVEGVPRGMVRRWLPFARNQEYSEDVVDQAADDIVRGLQERGYFNATVDTESELADNIWTTTFHVDPGKRYRLAAVDFQGNEKLDDDDLHGVVATTPRGGFRRFLQTLFRRPTGVTTQQLSEDRDALEAHYQREGFSEVTVETPIATAREDGTLTVEFPITEGPQTIVESVRIEGNQAKTIDALPRPQLEAGEPLNRQLVHDDVVALQTAYAEGGYSEVQVTSRVDVNPEKTSATVVYVIAEGPQVNIDDITVRGNTYTDQDVVLRKADLESGQPFNYTSILEAQRELYRLGIFQRVEIEPEQAGTTIGDRDITIQVEEGRNLTLSGSVGLRAERGVDVGSGTNIHERVALAAAHRNLFGTGRYLGAEGVFSTDQQEWYLTYREPFISRWNVPVQLQVFQSDDKTRGSEFLQRGTSIEASKVARLQTRWSLRYEYKLSECKEGDLCDALASGLPIESLERSLLDIQISSITPTFFWDRRDDIIDPHRGFFSSASVEYAFPLFSADAGFLKEYVQAAFYLPLSERTTLALSGRAGLIQQIARRTAFIDPVTGELNPGGDLLPVPISEKFFAGGEISHRGFPLDRLGNLCSDPDEFEDGRCAPTLIRDKDGNIIPIGGNSMFIVNAEYRFPIFGTFGGAVFADVGNVFAGSTIKFDKLRYGAGIGFRYLSPVGPLRIDIAAPIGKYEYEDSYQYFITLGYAF